MIVQLVTDSPAGTSRLKKSFFGPPPSPDEESVAENDFGKAPYEDEMKDRYQETVTSFMTLSFGRQLNWEQEI